MDTNNLETLFLVGQSPWYDNIDRRLIQNGRIEELFRLGITGVTSNPSIFEKAVNGSSVYDSFIRDQAEAGKSPDKICDLITIEDVQSAADLLYDTYKASEGRDGYVSLEVNPDYAYDPDKTINDARRIHSDVARPNLIIKVPGTREGLEPIRVLTREGININVTLLFSLSQYEASAGAYIDGITDRLRDGHSVERVRSVASVFVSRVDTKIDKMLDDFSIDELKGKIAVANAKMIYQRFKELFYNQGFGDLASKGVRIQRVLWGSTGTKNRAYSDVKYVDELIGKDTINTLPDATLQAFLDHGTPRLTIEEDLDKARQYLDVLQQQGIDLSMVCDEIQQQGVDAFCVSFNKLLDAIAHKARLAAS
ncbi:MAG: transaldolase [Desulfobacterales bacterium]|nr:transaldolase [Desulfobacterales bacterium]